MGKEQFDFSDPKDQEQFNALPKEAQEVLKNKTQEEADEEKRIRDEGGNDFSIPEHQKFFNELSEEKKEKRIDKVYQEAKYRKRAHDLALEYGLSEEEEELFGKYKIMYYFSTEELRLNEAIDDEYDRKILVGIIEKLPPIKIFLYRYGHSDGIGYEIAQALTKGFYYVEISGFPAR